MGTRPVTGPRTMPLPPDRSAATTRPVGLYVSEAREVTFRHLRTAGRRREAFASDWETVAITLELATGLCQRDGRAINGSCLLEMHWWDRVRAGDVLRVHARRVDDGGPSPPGRARVRLLLWTVNQAGRCVFSCLAITE